MIGGDAMKTRLYEPLRKCPALLWVGLALSTATPYSRADWAGLLVSATPQTPIAPGQALNIAVSVRNTGGSAWAAGLFPAWYATADNPSWTNWPASIPVVSWDDVSVGGTAAATLTVDPSDLPKAPGSYSLKLNAAYNWQDFDLVVMSGSPKTVSFTIGVAASNHAPVVVPIGDKAVVESNLLSFTVLATDSDTPAQTLTFSLNSSAPAGASINATTGLFTWTPPAGYAPRTNQITVRVTDNGSPPLSGTNSFNVVVLKPPRFDRIAGPTNGVVTLVWQSYPGKTYRLRYTENLASGSWTNLGSGILATNAVTSFLHDMGTARQRFYQVLLVD